MGQLLSQAMPWKRLHPASLWLLAGMGALALLVGLAALGEPGQLPARLAAATTIFLGIFLEALPFLLLGTVVSAAIHLWVSPERVRRWIPRGPLPSALAGVLFGLTILPVCECGTVPATRSLLAKGAPLPFGLAYLLAAPAINPIVIASTWVAFGGDRTIVFGRIGLTLVIALLVGVLVGAGKREDVLLPASMADGRDQHHHDERGAGRLLALIGHSTDEFFEMGRYLIVGAGLAALLQAFIPREALLGLGSGPFWPILTLMALAVVLSICSTVDAFVAVGFASLFSPGATLAFLVFGPMIDLKSILLFGTVFRRPTVVAVVALTAIWTIATTLVFDFVL